jgi:hypothetical protein
MKNALTKEIPNFLRRENTVYGIGCRNRTNLGKILYKCKTLVSLRFRRKKVSI